MSKGKEILNPHSLSPEGRLGTVKRVKAANEPNTMKCIPFQHKCLQPYRNKMKVVLIIAVLTVVMVTVPAVYTSITCTNQKTEIPNVNTSGLIQTRVHNEIPNINTSDLTKMTEVPIESRELTFNGM